MTDPDRRHPLQPLDAARIADYLNGRTVRESRLLPGGKSNTNWRVALDDGAVHVVRLCRPGVDPAAEATLMRIAARVAPVPEPLHAGADFLVLPFVTGEPPPRNAAFARAAGGVLAAVASVRFSAAGRVAPDGSVSPWPFEGGAAGFMETVFADARAAHRLGAERIEALRALLRREAGRLAEIGAGEARLVHGDFNAPNLLWRDGAVAAVLDWEFAHAGTPWMDVGNFLRTLPAPLEAPFAEGLRAGGMELPRDWRRRARLVDLSSALEFLTTARSEAFLNGRLAWIDAFLSEPGDL